MGFLYQIFTSLSVEFSIVCVCRHHNKMFGVKVKGAAKQQQVLQRASLLILLLAASVRRWTARMTNKTTTTTKQIKFFCE